MGTSKLPVHTQIRLMRPTLIVGASLQPLYYGAVLSPSFNLPGHFVIENFISAEEEGEHSQDLPLPSGLMQRQW